MTQIKGCPRIPKSIDFAVVLRQDLMVGEEAMIALFKKRVPGSQKSRGTRSARLRQSTTPVNPNVNIHFEAGGTDSWSHRRYMHEHETLIEAARCAMPYGAGRYVIAVENGTPRQLRDAEEEIVTRFRFGGLQSFSEPSSGYGEILHTHYWFDAMAMAASSQKRRNNKKSV